jgi:hypothetical protein
LRGELLALIQFLAAAHISTLDAELRRF